MVGSEQRPEERIPLRLGFPMVGGQAFDEIGNDVGLELGELEELRESKSGVRFRAAGNGEDVMRGVGQGLVKLGIR